MKDLKNKKIIVTGASGGIGNSIVEKLNEYGANILASGTKIEKLEERNANLEDSLQRLDSKFASLLVEQLEERNANLEDSLRSLDSKFSSLLAHFKQFASSLPSF